MQEIFSWDKLRKNCHHEKVMPVVNDDELLSMSSYEVRDKYPRFFGVCPDCKQRVICYASMKHYVAGDW